MNKRIGILTFHRSINYGAFMQSYSLSHYLKRKYPESTIEIIDYESKIMHDRYIPKVSITSFRHPIVYYKKKKQYNQFQNELGTLPLSKDYFVFDGLNESFNLFLNKNYDIIIVGSDAVWNWKMRSFPNPYTMSFNDGLTVLSYAASAYGMDYMKEKKECLDQFADNLKLFSYIGVRDNYTAEFVSKITNGFITPNLNCDPTFFLNISEVEKDAVPDTKDSLITLKKKYHIPLEKKLIGIMESNTRAVVEYKKKFKDYFFISLYSYTREADMFLGELAPCEWALLFGAFELTITNYYHGTLLSLVNNTPVIVTDRTEFSRKYLGKIPDVMNKMGLQDCCFVGGTTAKNMEHKIEEVLNKRSEYVETIKNGKELILLEKDSFDSAMDDMMRAR